MTDSAQTSQQTLEADAAALRELPFVADTADARQNIVSSLDARPRLREMTRELMARTMGSLEAPRVGGAHPVDMSARPSPTPGPRPLLLVRSAVGSMETRHPVDAPRFLIGRDDCDLELDDRFVARWHAQLFRRGAALVLQDLASRNGVYLRIADDLALEDGDRIALGEQRLEFRTTWDPVPGQRPGDAVVAGATWAGSPARLIRYVEGDQVGGVYPLGAQLAIGASQADLCFNEDSQLSAAHALIYFDSDRYMLRDLDSDFGTFIRIADAVEVIDGDCFLVGRTRIRLTFA